MVGIVALVGRVFQLDGSFGRGVDARSVLFIAGVFLLAMLACLFWRQDCL